MKVLLRIDSSEKQIPGGSSILGTVYENWGYIGRSPCKVDFLKYELKLFGVSPDIEIHLETKKTTYSLQEGSHELRLKTEPGEILTVKLSNINNTKLDYFELLLFGEGEIA